MESIKIYILSLLVFCSVFTWAQTGGTGRPPDGFRSDLKKYKKPISLTSKILQDQMKISVAKTRLKNAEGDLLKAINTNSPGCTSNSTDFNNLTEMHMQLALSKKSSSKNDVPDCYECSVNQNAVDAKPSSLAACIAVLPQIRETLVNFMNDEYIKIYLSQEYGYDSKQVDYFYDYYQNLFEVTNKIEKK